MGKKYKIGMPHDTIVRERGEKGKNLATKEDVEEITSKVEKIKSEFIKVIEYIKADLIYINQSKFSIKASERDALIDTNNKYSEWLNYLMNISFSDINSSNYEVLNEYYKEIKSKKLNFNIAQDNLHLFLHDEELMKNKSKCVTDTITLEHILNKAIINFIEHYNIRNLYIDNLVNLPAEQKPTNDFIQEQIKNSQKSLDEIFYKMNEDKSQQFAVVNHSKVLFVTSLKQRLYNIME